MILVPMPCWRTIRAVSECPWSSDGPYPLTMIWSAAGETFENMPSKDVSKARNKSDDAGTFAMRAGVSQSCQRLATAPAREGSRKETTNDAVFQSMLARQTG
jgi:hypothetical protein